jgi:hypothetical protein
MTTGRPNKEKGAEGCPSAPIFSCSKASGLGRQGPARLGDDRAEGVAFVHRDVGQHLAVEIDAGELQPCMNWP